MATLELRQVTKSFGPTKVIHGIDLSINHGEFIVFVGPSGCGKSTLLRMIAGLEPVTTGAVAIDGQVVNEVPAAERGLAMVFQSYALYPHMSVRQNLSFGLENLKTPKPEIQKRVAEAARMLRMEQLLERRPGQLSGGQRQRVAIGRAVVREPKIFLFDEPLSNLDAELRVQMRTEIGSLHQRLGNTMIYVTHDQVEAMTMADRIAVLKDGRLEQFGRPLDLYNRPANLFVAGFIGSPRMNFLNGKIAPWPRRRHRGARRRRPGRGSGGRSGRDRGNGREARRAAGAYPPRGRGRRDALRHHHRAVGRRELPARRPPLRRDALSVRLAGQTRVQRGDNVGLALAEPALRHLFDAGSGKAFAPLA